MPPLDKQIVDLGQRIFQAAFALAQPFAGVKKGAFAKAGTVHVPGTAGQVVGLVYQKQVVAPALKKARQMHHRVKQVVVIADDHIAPQTQIQSQLKGAHPVPACQFPQGVGGQGGRVQPVPQRRFHPVEVAVGVGAGFGRTLAAVLQTDLIFRGQRHAAQL